MEVLLLGGSNSVIKQSVQAGLNEHFNVKNLSLGGTSCIQNLCELTRHKNSIHTFDLIVTESNVNDVMNYANLKIPKDFMINLIDEYYRVLNNTGKPIVSLLLPTHFKQERKEDIEFIDSIHVKNCQKYGIPYIHFHEIMNNINDEYMDLLMPHGRHFNESYVYQVVSNLSKFIKKEYRTLFSKYRSKINGPDYCFLEASELLGDIKKNNKKNSVFNADLVEVNDKLFFPEKMYGYKLIAINAWCDSYSSAVIKSKDIYISKYFDKFYTSSELFQPMEISENTSIEMNTLKVPPTEPTILVRYSSELAITPLKIEGFLLVKDSKISDIHVYEKTVDLSNIVCPKIEPYISASRTLINLLKSKDK